MYVFLSIFSVWTFIGHTHNGRQDDTDYLGSFVLTRKLKLTHHMVSPLFTFISVWASEKCECELRPLPPPQDVGLPGTLISLSCSEKGGSGTASGPVEGNIVVCHFQRNLNWQFSGRLCKPHFHTGMDANSGQILSSVPTVLGLKCETNPGSSEGPLGDEIDGCVLRLYCTRWPWSGRPVPIPICFEVPCIVGGVEFLSLMDLPVFSVHVGCFGTRKAEMGEGIKNSGCDNSVSHREVWSIHRLWF